MYGNRGGSTACFGEGMALKKEDSLDAGNVLDQGLADTLLCKNSSSCLLKT
jgi:hypothetical protein